MAHGPLVYGFVRYDISFGPVLTLFCYFRFVQDFLKQTVWCVKLVK